ncbi:MAG: crossover junction endodeoxyribonuclease RuvC [Planctomycetota bacterium]|jgi:crossover junction endodeoxyribonuclease RuvC
MRIVGIDPGLRITGYGCVDVHVAGSEPTLVEGGVFRLQVTSDLGIRLEQLYEDLCQLLDELRPDLVVVERIFTHYRHLRTSILMGHARGVVVLAARLRSVELDELAATEVKKALTGNGHASKEQMQRAVMHQLALSEVPSPPDVADAIAIALCAGRRVAAIGESR